MSKIILLSSHFLPNDGGIARLMTELYKCLKEDNKEFSAVLLETENVESNISIIQIRKPRVIKEILAYLHLRKHKDIIISALWYPGGLIASFTPARQKIILVHGTELLANSNRFKEFFLKKIRNRVIAQADLIIANSHFTANLVKENFTAKRVEIIHPGTDIKRFSPSYTQKAQALFKTTGKFTLSTLSVIRKHKGLETIFDAIAELPFEIRKNILLLIGGKGNAAEYYKKYCRDKGIEDVVEWLGFIPEEKLADFYRASDLFLLTSVVDEELNAVEGFGMVLTEAQACGTPVVGTRSGGIIDAVEETKGGFLIAEKDSEKLKELIISLYQLPSLVEEMGKTARLRIENGFTWRIYYEKLLKLLFHIPKK